MTTRSRLPRTISATGSASGSFAEAAATASASTFMTLSGSGAGNAATTSAATSPTLRISASVAACSAVATVTVDPAKKLICNASASVPIGLYRIVSLDMSEGDRLDVTDLAVVMPPDDLAGFPDERRYLPKGLPLLKRVLALSGTTVCRNGAAITAYGMTYGQARERDGQGRPLPVWQGCRTLRAGEAFFMNRDNSDSFDSRYFGPLPLATVVGRAIPLWTTDDPDPVADSFREPVSDEP